MVSLQAPCLHPFIAAGSRRSPTLEVGSLVVLHTVLRWSCRPLGFGRCRFGEYLRREVTHAREGLLSDTLTIGGSIACACLERDGNPCPAEAKHEPSVHAMPVPRVAAKEHGSLSSESGSIAPDESKIPYLYRDAESGMTVVWLSGPGRTTHARDLRREIARLRDELARTEEARARLPRERDRLQRERDRLKDPGAGAARPRAPRPT